MLADRGEQRGKRGARLQPHADGELSIKIAAVDCCIVHIVNAVAALRKIFFDRAQQAGFARTGIATAEARPSSAAFRRSRADCKASVSSISVAGISLLNGRRATARWNRCGPAARLHRKNSVRVGCDPPPNGSAPPRFPKLPAACGPKVKSEVGGGTPSRPMSRDGD